MKKRILRILQKFFIFRFFMGFYIAFKFLLKEKKFIKPKGITYFYILNDYAFCFAKDLIEVDEYFFQYEFYKLKRFEKENFVTRNKFGKIERKLSQEIRPIFWNKEKFLKEFNSYIKRDWIDFSNDDEDKIRKFLDIHEKIILKPKTESLGKGIKLINTKDISIEEFLKECKENNLIAEECIVGNKKLQEFHPASLNTIRVVTFYNGEKFVVFGAFFRMGNENKNVDNAHAGGIFSTIDIETGIVITPGNTTDGKKYILHPYSGKQILGFKIPLWKEILQTCELATKHIKNIKVAGWDVAINEKNEIVIIEANHMPDFDLMQAPLKKGVKKEIDKILKEFFNIRYK